MGCVTHFGENLQKHKYSFKLVRDEFALPNTKPSLPVFNSLVEQNAYVDDTHTRYSQEWCEEYRKVCLQNYDLNMKYFASLSKEDFNNELENYLCRHKGFHEIRKLAYCDGLEGFYIMVLDEYKQVYIGKTYDIKKRIKQHWTVTKDFDRVLLPMYNTDSVFSIDFFRALDTTRIFVWEYPASDETEAKLIEDFPKIYCTNRIGGGVHDNMAALATMNRRKF